MTPKALPRLLRSSGLTAATATCAPFLTSLRATLAPPAQMILEAVAPSKLPIQLDMIRPMNAQNTVEFTLAFNCGATDVTWSKKGKSAFGIPA